MDACPGKTRARWRDKERRLSHPGACGSPRRRRWAQPLLPRSRGLRRDKRLFARKTSREPDRRRVTSTTACPAGPRKGVRASIWGTTTCACLVKWAGITPPVRDINTSFAADAGLIGRHSVAPNADQAGEEVAAQRESFKFEWTLFVVAFRLDADIGSAEERRAWAECNTCTHPALPKRVISRRRSASDRRTQTTRRGRRVALKATQIAQCVVREK